MHISGMADAIAVTFCTPVRQMTV